MKLMKFQREFLASWNINEVEGYLKRNCRRYITWSLYGVFPGFLGQCISVTYTRLKKKIARTTWPETHNEGTREGGTGLKRAEERVKNVRCSRSNLIVDSIPCTVELPSDLRTRLNSTRNFYLHKRQSTRQLTLFCNTSSNDKSLKYGSVFKDSTLDNLNEGSFCSSC